MILLCSIFTFQGIDIPTPFFNPAILTQGKTNSKTSKILEFATLHDKIEKLCKNRLKDKSFGVFES